MINKIMSLIIWIISLPLLHVVVLCSKCCPDILIRRMVTTSVVFLISCSLIPARGEATEENTDRVRNTAFPAIIFNYIFHS